MPTKITPSLAILAGLLAWATVAQFVACLSWGHDSWPLTEALINYAGGFVRRGLGGWLIGVVSDVTGIRANLVAIVSGFVAYFLLAAWFLRYSTRVFAPALILSCIVMGFPAYQDSIIRKDCLGVLLLLGCLLVDGSRLPRPASILVVNLLAGAAVLAHEAFAFFMFPALVLFVRRDQGPLTGRLIVRRCLAVLPAALCFPLTVLHHGSPAIAQAVNDSWLPLWKVIDPDNPHQDVPAAAIQVLGWTSEQGLSPGLNLLTSGFHQPAAWVILYVISFVLVILFTACEPGHDAADAEQTRVRVTAILLVQLACISPLFLLGYDYGRWLFFWLASSLMLHTLHLGAPRRLEALVARGFAKAHVGRFMRRVPASDWYLLFFGVPVCWNVYSFAVASPLGRHLRIIWTWFC